MISAKASVVIKKYSRRNRSEGKAMARATSPVKRAAKGQASHIGSPGTNRVPRSGSSTPRIT